MNERRTKAPRTARAEGRQVVLATARDLDVLALVGIARYAGLDQISRECFPNEDRARRRLRRLYDAGLLAAHVIDSRQPTLFTLTTKGRALLRTERPEVVDQILAVGTIELAGVGHHRAVLDARLYARGIGDLRGSPMRIWSNAGGALHRECNLSRFHLVPDGLARCQTPEGSIDVAVEVDNRATESLGVFGTKLTRYARVAAETTIDGLWIVVVAGAVRVANIVELVQRAGLGGWIRVLPHDHVVARPVRPLPARGGGPVGASSP